MSTTGDESDRDPLSRHLYDVDSTDPDSELVDRSALSAEDVGQIGRLMTALSRLREAEQALAAASERYMRLNRQDMQALHYLIVAGHRGEVITPGRLAAHLKISAASTTKLLNRLEKDTHIVRRVHPTDRRAFTIEVTPETRATAMQTVGRQQANRFHAAARLTPEQRETVIGFLEDMARGISPEGVDWAAEDTSGEP